MADLKESIHLDQGQGIASFSVERAQSAVLKLSGDMKKAVGAEVKARLLPRKGKTRISTRIGLDAPPGTHKAVLATEGGDIPVSIVVAPKKRLRLLPSSVEITGRPGDKIRVDLKVANLGNTDMALPAGGIAGLFASDGLAGAFSAAYGSATEAPLEVFGEFIDGLRRSHLGLVRLRLIDKVKSPLKPGDKRDLIGEFSLPEPQNEKTQIGAGRRFHATFVMDRLRLVMRLTLSAPIKKGEQR
ncbi:hypothetical protein [uncultured Roseobacter sp.]|uniref:COG1470 family protein n=1 Tax=uncultured Roseobacter sp. TaxID=114847 RepID=UPI00260F23C4|nr:hypothetical protein [uncultured Roseobacter sp.]